MRITALERQRRGKRINLQLDGAFACGVSIDVCLRFGLRVGDDLDEARLADVQEAEAREAAMESALRLLALRPRSESELRQRLARKGTPERALEGTVGRVRELKLIDDLAFASFFVESRDRTSPRSRALLASELRAKGIVRELARKAVAVIDEQDAAYRAARRRAALLKSAQYPQFRRKLADFMLRRGFSHELSCATVSRLWLETGHAADAMEEEVSAFS